VGDRLMRWRRGVGTDSEFTDDASRWWRQRADASAPDVAVKRPSNGCEFHAQSADPPLSGCDVLSAAERQSAHAGD